MPRTASSPMRSIREFALKAFKSPGFMSVNALSKQPEQAATFTFPALSWPAVDEPSVSAASSPAPCGIAVRSDISQEDWDALFRAVGHRLRMAVGERPVPAALLEADDVAGHVQEAVLDGVDCLNLLHAALIAQRAAALAAMK